MPKLTLLHFILPLLSKIPFVLFFEVSTHKNTSFLSGVYHESQEVGTLSKEVRELAFTPEELEAMRLADEEIEREFYLSIDDIAASNELDRASLYDRKSEKERKVAAQNKAYREANKDKIAEYNKAYRKANKDKIAARRKAYYEANKDNVLEYQKAYYEANKDKIAARRKAYYEANKDKVKRKENDHDLERITDI